MTNRKWRSTTNRSQPHNERDSFSVKHVIRQECERDTILICTVGFLRREIPRKFCRWLDGICAFRFVFMSHTLIIFIFWDRPWLPIDWPRSVNKINHVKQSCSLLDRTLSLKQTMKNWSLWSEKVSLYQINIWGVANCWQTKTFSIRWGTHARNDEI